MKLFYAFSISVSVLTLAQPLRAQSNYFVHTGNADAPGFYNTQVGAGAGITSNGSENTFMGYQAGKGSSGGRNSFFGVQAGMNNNTGNENAFFGSQSGDFNRSGSSNTFLGAQAGYRNDNGNGNVFAGKRAGFFNGAGSNNVFVGFDAGNGNTTAEGNVALGYQAAYANQSGTQNTTLGYRAGANNTASANTFIGYQAGLNNTTGQFNTFVGVNAGIANTTGNSNFMLGTNAGANSTMGSANFFVGDNAGSNNTSGSYNVFLGTNAGVGNVTGFNNTAIGFEANVGGGGLVNATAIGFRAVASVDNSVVLGNAANVGIGTSAPASRLHVVSGTAGQSGLRLENLTSSNPATVLNQTKFLTVDASGNVILASLNSSGREGATEGLWQRNGSYLQSAQGEAVIIGSGVSKTPVDYNLFVSKGILTEKVKVAVKNTSEWSDYVFAPDYKLTPLAEVEQYVKQNRHLPGVPSAEEVVQNGVDVARMDAKLLEKVEETMLYVLQLKREVDQLRQQNRQLQRTVSRLKHR